VTALDRLALDAALTEVDPARSVAASPQAVTHAAPLHRADRKRGTEQTLSRTLNHDMRQPIGPILTWRLARAAVFGWLSYAFTRNPPLAIGPVLMAAFLRPKLRLLNQVAWQQARSRAVGTQTPLRDGAGI
jgi:hypothetical protein